ncbi:MAG TPA: dihydroorotate dehydrogenase [Caldisericia bacterium]|nr:dihydroorotate dehydrogenase [Caldisericia bacterium]
MRNNCMQVTLQSPGHMIQLKNPIIPASGTFGDGSIVNSLYDVNQLGALLTKSITLHPRQGNPSPRIYETPGGILNSVGLENKGVKWFLEEVMPFVLSLHTSKWISIAGFTVDDFVDLTHAINPYEVDAIEVNVSCPNIHKNGIQFCQNKDVLQDTLHRVRKATDHFLIAKIALETNSLSEILEVIQQEGFDAVCIGNTIRGIAIDPISRKPFFRQIFAGLSGPAIKPIALRVVWEAFSSHPTLPIIGCGGIQCASDVIEFICAGASAVEVGTMNLVDPFILPAIIQDISTYCTTHDVTLSSIIGSSHRSL